MALAVLLLSLALRPLPAWAAELSVSEVTLEPCPAADVASQPDLPRATGARCYALRGMVDNPGRRPVFDTDVYARILDASGEPSFALRLAVPAGTPGPLSFRSVRARGFNAPVRTRAGEGEELLPLEQALAAQ
ncbi:MAG: hypothetical protein MUD04_04435 [Cyanobium sp. Prado107]|nr:hypothetical protein [Cyanobium sp. Prado107]